MKSCSRNLVCRNVVFFWFFLICLNFFKLWEKELEKKRAIICWRINVKLNHFEKKFKIDKRLFSKKIIANVNKFEILNFVIHGIKFIYCWKILFLRARATSWQWKIKKTTWTRFWIKWHEISMIMNSIIDSFRTIMQHDQKITKLLFHFRRVYHHCHCWKIT